MVNQPDEHDAESIIILDDNTQARLDLWERMAKAVIRAYKHDAGGDKELAALTFRIRELEPSLRDFYPLD
jgi:hypothetical protein